MKFQKKRQRLNRAVFASALLLASPFALSDEKPEPLSLRIAAAYASDIPVFGPAQTRLVESINAAAGGGIEATLVPPDEIVPVEKILNAVANGSIAAAYTDPSQWVDRDPAFALFSGLPLSVDVKHTLSWIQRGGGSRLMKDLYAGYNVEPLVCGAFVRPAGLWVRKPVNQTSELVGLKVSASGLGATLLATLGAKVTPLNELDATKAFESGAINAVHFRSMSLSRQQELLGENERYLYPQGWGEQYALRMLIIGRQYWAALTPAHRVQIQQACDSATLQELSRTLASRADALVFLKTREVSTYRWSPEILETMKEAWERVTSKFSESSPRFAAGWKSLSEFTAGAKAFDALAK